MVRPGIINPQHSVIDQGNKPRLLRIYSARRISQAWVLMALLVLLR